MRYPNPLLLLYVAMADAYAIATEYVSSPEHDAVVAEALTFKHYVPHPVMPKWSYPNEAGLYTDDTEMSLANAHVLLDQESPYQPLMFANAYVDEFQRGGRRVGYSRNFQAILERVKTGAEFLNVVKPISIANGAAMRATPLGVLKTVSEVLEVATLQAQITHDTPEGRFSARAVALMSHFALYETAPLREIASYCMTHLPSEDTKVFSYIFQTPWINSRVMATPCVSVAAATVHAAVDLVSKEHCLMDILKRIIEMGGDTDSVAAVAWGIASSRMQDEPLPPFLVLDLEGRNKMKTGPHYLVQVGTHLMQKFA